MDLKTKLRDAFERAGYVCKDADENNKDRFLYLCINNHPNTPSTFLSNYQQFEIMDCRSDACKVPLHNRVSVYMNEPFSSMLLRNGFMETTFRSKGVGVMVWKSKDFPSTLNLAISSKL